MMVQAGGGAIGALAIMLIVGVVSAIYHGIREGVRTKFENESEKEEYLLKKYEDLVGKEVDGYKIDDIYIESPRGSNPVWKIHVSEKKGTWPFNSDRERQVDSISDEKLSKKI